MNLEHPWKYLYGLWENPPVGKIGQEIGWRVVERPLLEKEKRNQEKAGGKREGGQEEAAKSTMVSAQLSNEI